VERTLTEGFSQICPLYAFTTRGRVSQRVDLGEGIAISRISYDLVRLIDKRIPELALDSNKVQWVIQLPFNPRRKRISKSQTSLYSEVLESSSEIVIDLITAIRLQHEGDVAPGPLLQLDIRNRDFNLGETYYQFHVSKSGNYAFFAGASYELFKTDLNSFTEFWQSFQDKRQKGKLDDLKIALRRFNSSYGEILEDRLLDQMIALESLYLVDPQELSYRLALRAAFLIGADEKQRKQVLNDLKDAYNARSKIIHGKKPPANLPELVVKTEECLRQSIRHILKLSDKYKLKQLRGPLDKANQQEDPLFDQNILSAGKLLRA